MSLTGKQERTIIEIIALMSKVEGIKGSDVEFEPPGKPQIIVTAQVDEHSTTVTKEIIEAEEKLEKLYPDFDVQIMIRASQAERE